MDTPYDAANAALTQLAELLPDRLKLEHLWQERDNEIKSRERFVLELKELRAIHKPLPWQMERLKMLKQGEGYDKDRLAELYEERQRHEELTQRLTEAEQILFRFGDARGIDTNPLLRLLSGDLESADAVISMIRRLSASLDREDKAETGGKQIGRPSAKTVTVNERMAAMLQADPLRVEWSASEWAQRLSNELGRSVSPAAVKQTDTWKKQIKAARTLMKVERATRKR